MKKLLIELIGTFFLTFTVALTANPVAIGAILIAMTYMGGYISGAHYNPAVTLGVLLRRRITVKTALGYMLFQLIGAALAAGVYYLMAKSAFVPAPTEGLSIWLAFACELLFSFALVSVVLHVATSDKVKDNYYYGVAIGLTVMAAAFSIGQISGGIINPAIGLGSLLVDAKNLTSHVSSLGLYLVTPFIGSLLATLVYRFTSDVESAKLKASEDAK